MENIVRPEGPNVMQSRKALRLTFRFADGEVRLASYERLDMICPPSVGEPPEAGKHGGFWMELRDADEHVLFYRVLDTPLGDSVEVHSPDGTIQRVFGAVEENVFEVLLPDDSRGKTIAFMGESLEPATVRKEQGAETRELVRFNMPEEMKGGEVDARGSGQ